MKNHNPRRTKIDRDQKKVDLAVIVTLAFLGCLIMYGVVMWIYTLWSFLEPMNH